MVLLFLAMACGTGEPETAEEWCEVATAAMCECPDVGNTSTDCEDYGCDVRAAATEERWSEAYAIDLFSCLAEHPCADDWDQCP